MKQYTQIHYLFPHIKESYIDTSYPTPASKHELTAYYNAFWGSQVDRETK